MNTELNKIESDYRKTVIDNMLKFISLIQHRPKEIKKRSHLIKYSKNILETIFGIEIGDFYDSGYNYEKHMYIFLKAILEIEIDKLFDNYSNLKIYNTEIIRWFENYNNLPKIQQEQFILYKLTKYKYETLIDLRNTINLYINNNMSNIIIDYLETS